MGRNQHWTARNGLRLAAMLATAVALFLQVFVVQTHTHAQAQFSGFGYERLADHLQDGHSHVSVTHEPGGCIVCQAFAASGQSIAPNAAILSEAHNGAYDVAARAIRRAPRALTHVWQSRAPPTAL